MIKITLKIFTILIISLNVATIAQSDFSYKKIASDNNYSESRELSISVFNNAISQYNFKKTLLPYQSIPEVTILNKDNLLLVYSQEGLVEFYRNFELLTKHLFYKSHQQNEQSILAKASINDVAILISEKAENKIFIFDFSGNLKDSVIVNTGIISGLAYSEDGKYLAASVYNWEKDNLNKLSIIFNRENNTSINIDENFNNGSFSDNNLFLGFTNKTAFYFDLNNNDVLWVETINENEVYIDGISENTNAVLVKANVPNLTNGQWIYSNAKIISKDYFNVEKEIKEINSEVSKVSLSKNNNKIFLNVDENKIEIGVEK